MCSWSDRRSVNVKVNTQRKGGKKSFFLHDVYIWLYIHALISTTSCKIIIYTHTYIYLYIYVYMYLCRNICIKYIYIEGRGYQIHSPPPQPFAVVTSNFIFFWTSANQYVIGGGALYIGAHIIRVSYSSLARQWCDRRRCAIYRRSYHTRIIQLLSWAVMW
jgi:hypothetical protein